MTSSVPDIEDDLATQLTLNLGRYRQILTAIVEADYTSIFNAKGEVLLPKNWSEDVKHAIKGFKLGANGKPVAIEWHDRLKAAQDLAKLDSLDDKADDSLLAQVPRGDLKALAEALDKMMAEDRLG